MPFGDFRRKLNHYGITIKPGGKGSHFKLYKTIGEVKIMYVIAVHHNKVDFIYVEGMRRRFRLTNADGVSDEEFRLV